MRSIHLTVRYGTEEIKKWYFEVRNEPNHPAQGCLNVALGAVAKHLRRFY